MDKEFVSYEQAVVLKKLGAGFPYIAWYLPNNPMIIVGPATISTTDIPAPLKQQVFRWFREKHNIVAPIYSNASGYLYEWHDALGGTQRGWSEFEGPNNGGAWDTYEEAENACIDKLIELSKQQ